MENKEKILEAIKRLNDIPPSRWNLGVVLKVKSWLLPKVVQALTGEPVKKMTTEDQIKYVKDNFKKE